MSIYATLGEILVPTNRERDWCDGGFHSEYGGEYALVVFQGVPPHIGHPCDYPDGDPYGAFLPPPVQLDAKSEIDLDYRLMRAVVVVGPKTTKGAPGHGQEYANPLLVLTGEEWNRIPWPELWSRIERAFETHFD